MKADIHPNVHPVIFHDTSCDEKFLINSTYTGEKTEKWTDGNTYPVCTLDTSSASHPFYTGGSRIETSEGRSAKFKAKFGNSAKAKKPAETKDSKG